MANDFSQISNDPTSSVTCSCNKDCEHLEKAKTCQQVEGDAKVCKETKETTVCSKTQFLDVENSCKELNECGTNTDCKEKYKSVCKEEDGKRTCVPPRFCLSKCSPSDFCDSLHKCVGPPPCKSDVDCPCNHACIINGKTSLPSCQPDSQAAAKMDECSTSEDCVKIAKDRPVCKESSGRRTCVHPYQCMSQCTEKEICNHEHKCVVSHPCRSNNDCRAGEFCWWAKKEIKEGCGRYIFTEAQKEGSDQIGPGVGQGTCRSSTDLVSHQCVINKDCEETQRVRKVCKDVGKRRSCVHPDECLAACSSKEVCDSKHQCKLINTCKDDSDCPKGEACLESTCRPTFFNSTEQCGSNLDCKTMGGSQSVCKEDNKGRRICRQPGIACLSTCQLDELCDSLHR